MMSAVRITRRRRAVHREALDVDHERPATRADCEPGGINEARPCPFVSCRYHLAIDVTRSGTIKLNFAGVGSNDTAEALRSMTDTCVLDVADSGRHTLRAVSQKMNVTRERVRQIEAKIFSKLQSPGLREPEMQKAMAELRNFRPDGKLHLPVLKLGLDDE